MNLRALVILLLAAASCSARERAREAGPLPAVTSPLPPRPPRMETEPGDYWKLPVYEAPRAVRRYRAAR